MSQIHGIPIKCKKCEEIFIFYHKLVRHKKKAHKQDDLCKFSFLKCDAKYKVKHAFEQHLGAVGIKLILVISVGKPWLTRKGYQIRNKLFTSPTMEILVVMCVEDVLQKYPCETIFRLRDCTNKSYNFLFVSENNFCHPDW